VVQDQGGRDTGLRGDGTECRPSCPLRRNEPECRIADSGSRRQVICGAAGVHFFNVSHRTDEPRAEVVGDRGEKTLSQHAFSRLNASSTKLRSAGDPASGTRTGTAVTNIDQTPSPVNEPPEGPENGLHHRRPSWEGRVVGRSLAEATKRSLDRGASLIRAAATLMERTKGDSFTVQEVANEAGLSLRSFYQHFGSKDDLLLAVYEEAMRVYALLLNEDVDRFSEPLDRLVAGVMSVAHLTRRSSEGIVVVLSKLRLEIDQADPTQSAELTKPVTSTLRSLVLEAEEAGIAGPYDADSAAYLIFSLSSAVSLSRMVGNAPGLDAPTDIEFARFCLRGINARLPEDWEGQDYAVLGPARPGTQKT
jgi:AcrR family transcriptional regulator